LHLVKNVRFYILAEGIMISVRSLSVEALKILKQFQLNFILFYKDRFRFK